MAADLTPFPNDGAVPDLFPSVAVRELPTLMLCGGSGMHWFFDSIVREHVSSLAASVATTPAKLTSPSTSPGPFGSSPVEGAHGLLYAALEAAALGAAEGGVGRSVHSRPLLVVVPVTDDGGSSRSIIDVLGGPAVGDLRNVILMLARVTVQATHHTPRRTHALRRSMSEVHGRDSPNGDAPLAEPPHAHGGFPSDHWALSDEFDDPIDSLPPPVTPTGEAAVRYFSEPDLAASELFLHRVLKFRLDSADEAVARSQRDALVSAFARADPDSALWRVGAAFTRFSEYVQPNFAWRNASVGNMFLAGRVLQLLAPATDADVAAPAHVVVARALEQAALELMRILGVPPHITVAPACSWMAAASHPPLGDLVAGGRLTQRLPRYELDLVTADGSVVRGQTRVSYGTDGVVAKAHGDVLPDWAAHGDPQQLSAAMRCGPSPAAVCAAEAPAALRHDAGASYRRRIVLGCGSFLTSTVAAAATADQLWAAVPEPLEAVMLVNGTIDRETAVFFEPARGSACGCDAALASNAVLRMLAVVKRSVPPLAAVSTVMFADGSPFAAPCDRLQALQASRFEGLCDECANAVSRACVTACTQFVRCRGIPVTDGDDHAGVRFEPASAVEALSAAW